MPSSSTDTLCQRLIVQISEEDKFHREVEENEQEKVIFVTDLRLQQIRYDTSKDLSLQTIVARDSFEFDGQHYLVVVDLLSDYNEIKELRSLLTTAELVDQMKQVFAVHDFPVTLISDNGINYASQEFSLFAKAWDFHHLTYSANHPKAISSQDHEIHSHKSHQTGKEKISGKPS